MGNLMNKGQKPRTELWVTHLMRIEKGESLEFEEESEEENQERMVSP